MVASMVSTRSVRVSFTKGISAAPGKASGGFSNSSRSVSSIVGSGKTAAGAATGGAASWAWLCGVRAPNKQPASIRTTTGDGDAEGDDSGLSGLPPRRCQRNQASSPSNPNRTPTSTRCTPEEIRMGRMVCSAATGPFQPNCTRRHSHSGSAGPVWIWAFLS